MNDRERPALGYVFIILAASLWGLSGTLAKYIFTQHNIDTLIVVQMRVTISFILLLVLFLIKDRRLLMCKPRDLKHFALLGIIGIAGSNFFYYYAINLTTVATAILVQYTAPVMVMMYAVTVQREPLELFKVLALILAMFGVFLAVGGNDISVFVVDARGIMSALLAGIAFAFFSIYGRSNPAKYSVWTTLTYTLGSASMFWLFINPPWAIAEKGYSLEMWSLFGLIAVTSILLPYLFFIAGLRHLISTRAVITATLEPIVAIFSASVFLSELLLPIQIAGAASVISAVVLLQIPAIRSQRKVL
jgi:drug/metabolite transporter (DMT)-like permease